MNLKHTMMEGISMEWVIKCRRARELILNITTIGSKTCHKKTWCSHTGAVAKRVIITTTLNPAMTITEAVIMEAMEEGIVNTTIERISKTNILAYLRKVRKKQRSITTKERSNITSKKTIRPILHHLITTTTHHTVVLKRRKKWIRRRRRGSCRQEEELLTIIIMSLLQPMSLGCIHALTRTRLSLGAIIYAMFVRLISKT